MKINWNAGRVAGIVLTAGGAIVTALYSIFGKPKHDDAVIADAVDKKVEALWNKTMEKIDRGE
jgi:hypothetical protein